ncbi:MAG TPA: restriction endonuclease subunit S [Allocoleopsis sp.]
MGMRQLYEERFQSIVHQTTLQGLNPEVPMQNPNVEWVEQIPAHWVKKRLKYVGRQISVADFLNALGEQQERTIAINKQTLKATRELAPLFPQEYFFECGNEVVRHGKWVNGRIRHEAMPADRHFFILLPEDQFPLYWEFYLNSHFAYNWFCRELPIGGSWRESRRSDLTLEVLKNLPVFVPPLEEQQAIATHLEQAQQVTKNILELL